MAKLTSKKENVLTARIDLLRMLHTVPRSERWEKIGLINDPDCVPAEKPDQYGLKIDRMKDGTLTWDPEVFGFSSGVVGLQLFKNKNFDAKKWSIDKYLDDASQRGAAVPRWNGLHLVPHGLQPQPAAEEPGRAEVGKPGLSHRQSVLPRRDAVRLRHAEGHLRLALPAQPVAGHERDDPLSDRLHQWPGPDQLDLPPERSPQAGACGPNLARAEGHDAVDQQAPRPARKRRHRRNRRRADVPLPRESCPPGATRWAW